MLRTRHLYNCSCVILPSAILGGRMPFCAETLNAGTMAEAWDIRVRTETDGLREMVASLESKYDKQFQVVFSALAIHE